jgi:hypothetical protein
MDLPEIPSSEEALKQIAKIIPPIYDAMEAGTQGARAFFEREQAPIDPYHASSHVRWEAKRRLQAQGREVADVDYKLHDLPMNGLRLNFEDCLIWILKSDNGKVPPPGPSGFKQAFYLQRIRQLVLPMAPFTSEPQADEDDGSTPLLSLVILWEVTRDYRLDGLLLACPRAGDTTRTSVQLYWGPISVPHPALSVEGDSTAHDIDDLDIRRIDEDEEEEEAGGPQ